MSRAWVLNLDAEHELEREGRYAPSAAVAARMERIAREIARGLEPGDVVVGEHPPDGRYRARAWCPTPSAIARLARAGLRIEGAPTLEVLRRVNERGFAASLDRGELERALRATSIDEVEAHVASPGPTGEWLLKRAFGVAGRGQRPVHPGRLSDADRAWALASLRSGALYVEPRVSIVRELSAHGWAMARGVVVRSIRAQVVSERAWVRSELARELDAGVESAIVDAAARVGGALIDAGYHGPFGVDSYLWRTASGAIAVRALSEINARYCMGWDARDGWDPPV